MMAMVAIRQLQPADLQTYSLGAEELETTYARATSLQDYYDKQGKESYCHRYEKDFD